MIQALTAGALILAFGLFTGKTDTELVATVVMFNIWMAAALVLQRLEK